jgi:XTP/dITP diphosphohydrolase
MVSVPQKMLLPKKILIATGNKGKFHEISDLLQQINIEAIPSFQFNIEEPQETEETFAANSLLKAKYYAKKTTLFSLADDSGLCVEAMNGAPGIHSARFALDENGEKNFPLAFEKIAKNITNNHRAYFICNLALFDPQTNFSINFEGRIDGELTFPARGNQGFGYDSIFIKNGMGKTFGEISTAEKDQISHRAEAFKKLLNWLNSGDL